MSTGSDLRVAQDEADAFKKIAQAFKESRRDARVGVEERVRFAVYDGIRKEAPSLEFASADPVTAGCRIIKSPAEIALLQRANDITIEAYRAAFATLREGMTQRRSEPTISPPRLARWASAAARWRSSASTPRFRTAASRRRNCAKAIWS